MKTLLDRFRKSEKNSRPELALRRTSSTTVKEILDTFAPPREGSTGAQLVSFGPQEYFLVIQGPEGKQLTSLILDYIEALYARAEKQHEHSN